MSAAATVAPYGTWSSDVSARMVAASSNAVVSVQADGEELFWLEARPQEQGRMVLMRHLGDGEGEAITPEGFYVRTTVHEYGGAAYLVADGTVYFSNMSDQGLYRQQARAGAQPEKMNASSGVRYADCSLDPGRERLICVREDHRGEGEAVNALVAMPLRGDVTDGDVVWADSDFVAYPRLNPAGDRMAWISWDHPNMPWDNVSLWLADVLQDGTLANARRVNAGVDESVLQPTWDEQGRLYVLADRGGWWNLYRVQDDGLAPVHQMQAELGGPLWGLGTRFFALSGDGRALVEPHTSAGTSIGWLALETGEFTELDMPFSGYASFTTTADTVYMLAGRRDGPDVIASLDVASSAHAIVRENGKQLMPVEDISTAQAITFPTAGGSEAYAYYYPPKNPAYEAPAGEAPPLLVLMHGGPTAATSASFSIAKQYWTSRGIGIVDVNYRGSTGYGRAYRQALNGQWGVVDLEDAVHVTRHLVSLGQADPQRLMIRGGSAGGYTTLSALAFTDEFAAGANYFGVSDLEALAIHTHKFESRYLDSMIGPYPEAKEVYDARSPINALDGFNAPLITFQGLEDKIVPPAQSEKIYAAVKAKGTPTAYLAFEGEQHGFRMAQNTIAALEAELYFYGKVLGFEPADDLPEIEIDNLPQ